MTGQNRAVDFKQRLIRWECHVEGTEKGDKSRVHLVSATSGFAHGCDVTHILEVLPVEVLASVIQTPSFQEEFEQCDWLLGAVCVNLSTTNKT